MVPLTVVSCVSFRGGLEASGHVISPRYVVSRLPPACLVPARQSLSGPSAVEATSRYCGGCFKQLPRRRFSLAANRAKEKPRETVVLDGPSAGDASSNEVRGHPAVPLPRQNRQTARWIVSTSRTTPSGGLVETGQTKASDLQGISSFLAPSRRALSSAAFLHPLVGSEGIGRQLPSRCARDAVGIYRHLPTWSFSRKPAMARANRMYQTTVGTTEDTSFGVSETLGKKAGNHGRLERTRNFTFAKQVATIGPASWDYEEIERLFLTGVDVFRLNMSHGLLSEKHQQLLHVRRVEQEFKHPIGVLADLPGPKFRLGCFENEEAFLEVGQTFILDSSPVLGDATRVHLPHPEILEALRPHDTLLVDDGKLKLRVLRTTTSGGQSDTARSSALSRATPTVVGSEGLGEDTKSGGELFLSVECEVIVGGTVSSKKGINLPASVVPISALSSRDRELARTVAGWGVDWIALSFVQSAEDVHALRQELRQAAASSNGRIREDISIVVKVEKPVALKNFESILSAADGVMVARGDLGVELQDKMAYLPSVQKRLVELCREAGKPVIVATQMLESMTRSPVPTRAEVSDVGSAVYDGTDAVMLSGETAAGDFPALVAQTQRQGLQAVESDPRFWRSLHPLREAFRQSEERRIQQGLRANSLARNQKEREPNSGWEVPLRASQGAPSMLKGHSESSEDITAEILRTFLSQGGETTQFSGSPADGPHTSERDGMKSTKEEPEGASDSQLQGSRMDLAWLPLGAEQIARLQRCKAIVVFTEDGSAARRLAALRPVCPVLAAVPDPLVARQLQLYWGVHPVLLQSSEQPFSRAAAASVDALLQTARQIAQEEGFLTSPTDELVVVGSVPVNANADGAPGARAPPCQSIPFLTVSNARS